MPVAISFRQIEISRPKSTIMSSESSSDPLCIILFYKYHAFSSSRDLMAPYRGAMETLCQSLNLTGRILLGCSDNEGINGTLAGTREHVRLFTYALLGEAYVEKHYMDVLQNKSTNKLLQQFWKASRDFAQAANVSPLIMESPDDFKWSTTTQQQSDLFPDLQVKLVKEIIGTGGVLSEIPIQETQQGYLTPQEWHEEMMNIDTSSTVLIDCRNTKEVAIGHFPNAVNPHTATFHEFPKWAEEHAPQLKDKRLLMYCTGGIRCEKASAFLRRQGVQNVQHLKGGIHKYLENYGNEGMWKGKNFVFDGRGAATAHETKLGKDGSEVSTDNDLEEEIVGKCLYCSCPYDTFHAHCVCTVCREPTLVCGKCQEEVREYHCSDHFHLHTCYFTNLSNFSKEQLTRQLEELEQHLETIAVGKRYKQKRKTLHKQCDKIRLQLQASDGDTDASGGVCTTLVCRNCGEASCNGACWGFHGLKRKEVLDKKQTDGNDTLVNDSTPTPSKSRSGRPSAGQRVSKQLQRQRAVQEIEQLRLSQPPSQHLKLGIRVPPPCTRVLETMVKGKWCGRPFMEVLQTEFAELAKPQVFANMLDKGLLRLNNEPLTNETVNTKLKNMDVISRIVHWHEPPIRPPDVIRVEKLDLPPSVGEANGHVYVCDKPSSVPVHPAGPYLSNTLTMMVEAQEKLEIRSLIPCHRIDRVASGLTVCCTDSKTARIIQGKMDEGTVRKLYVARVKGRFPNSQEAAVDTLTDSSSYAKWSWKHKQRWLEVDAPVETEDAGNGIRIVSAAGKPSRSRFQFLGYDSASDSSLIACSPLTGRGHQLRVHSQWLGFPIDGDVSYGGRSLDSDCSDIAVERMLETVTTDTDEETYNLSLGSISTNDVAKATSACVCCSTGKEGIVSSFTPAQLLNGSEIYLHALRYEIIFSQRKRKTIQGDQEPHSVMGLEVGLPKWALGFKTEDIEWLQDSTD